MNFIREIKEKDQKPFWQIILMIFLSVLVINNLITLCNKLEDLTGIDANISSVIVLFLSLILVAVFILKLISNFAYTLTEDMIGFERIIGKRSDRLLEVPLSDIIFIKPYTKMKKDKSITHEYRFIYKIDKEHVYYGEFIKDEKKYRFIFMPSERMIRILNSKVNENTNPN